MKIISYIISTISFNIKIIFVIFIQSSMFEVETS